jgi:hypothetical protein
MTAPPTRQPSCPSQPPPRPSPHPPLPGRPAPGNRPGSGRTQGNARSAQPRTSSRARAASADLIRGSSVVSALVRGRPCKAAGSAHRSLAPIPVRYASVDPTQHKGLQRDKVTHEPTVLQHASRAFKLSLANGSDRGQTGYGPPAASVNLLAMRCRPAMLLPDASWLIWLLRAAIRSRSTTSSRPC